MATGRKPKPTALKLVHGNPGKRPLNEHEPQPMIEIPKMPDHLSAEAAAEWNRVTGELATLGLLANIDRAALAAYCQAYGRWVEAEAAIRRIGLLAKTTSGNVIQNPLVGIANRAMELMYRFMTEFGMTPSSRSRLSVEPGVGARRDPTEKYFAG